uniref:Serine protease 30 n=1 Tax=Mamestra configurata TaxID=174822 RepID=E0W9N6_9NEOP|nr:serine protease 30 [Mamestra configurata]
MNNFVFLLVIALCGTRASTLNVDGANRIIGGTLASDTQFRYMVSLQQLSQVTNYMRGHRCGGALVSLRHAVTIASCLHGANGAVIDPAQYRVFAGASVLTNDTSVDRHRRIEKFTIHPNYRTATPYVNDIAVITLASAFPSNAVSTVSLSQNDATTQQGAICQSSGWGSQNDTSTASTQLMYTTKYVYESQACQMFYSGVVPGFSQMTIQNSMICAMPTTISSSCTGDLGNPLVCNGNLNGLLIVTAYDCSNVASIIARPEVYTRISTFRSWINTTAGASTFQPGMAVLALISIVRFLTSQVFN